MAKHLSAKYYLENEARLQKKVVKDIVVIVTKVSQKMKNNSLLSIERNIRE